MDNVRYPFPPLGETMVRGQHATGPPGPLGLLATKSTMERGWASSYQSMVFPLYLCLFFSLYGFECLIHMSMMFVTTFLSLYGGALISLVVPLTHGYLT